MSEMVLYRSCLESELNSRPVINGSFILCTDSGNLYHDVDDERIRISKSIAFLGTESNRTSILTPEDDVLYIVLATGKMWIYTSSGWECINKTTEYYYVHNVAVASKSSTEVTDIRIRANDTAKFIVNPNVADLVDGTVTCTCAAGKITVASTCSYKVYGIIEVTTIE